MRDRLALAAALAGPFLVALALVPFRTDLSRTNAALILVVVVVAVAAIGSRAAGALAALSAAAWFDFFLTRPYERFSISGSDDIELRAYGNGHYLGRFMLSPGPGAVPPLQARLVAVALADRTGGALDTVGPVRDGNG
ncbi:DUF4118 domain-containing protein [Streptomyces lutosisoli]|uniref:DUF4118 domain-containing protein n=1 Tax=Streptomyces lutosisoli TaxID=2665721 RepID=UPI003AA8CF3E